MTPDNPMADWWLPPPAAVRCDYLILQKVSRSPPLHGHMNAVTGVAFSANGRRLISTSGARETVKLWDVGTRQELLTLSGARGSDLGRWSADGDVILAGPPWQAWRAPSWEEIAETEAKEKTQVQRP
jgi:hypothetical protein